MERKTKDLKKHYGDRILEYHIIYLQNSNFQTLALIY